MLKKPFTLEQTFYLLAFAIALGLRFFHLGSLPLSDFEAETALQSLGIVNGASITLGSNTGYIHLTALLFYVFSASDFLARFLPALAGTCLSLVPWFFRSRIGRIPAIVLAFGFALDPGFNAISRLAGGPMLAIAFLLLAVVLWLDARRPIAGLFAGLALLSGPSVWFGIFSLLLAWGIFQLLPKNIRAGDVPVDGNVTSGSTGIRTLEFKQALFWGIGSLLVVGSLLFLSPQGLVGLVKSFISFFSGWWELSGMPLGRVFLALPAYELLPVFFGLISLVRGIIRRDTVAIRLGIWALAALLLVVIYVGRQTTDLCWALLPLWMLTSIEVGRYFDFSNANRWVVGGAITFMFVLLTLAWMTLGKITLLDPVSMEARLQWIFVGGILLVIVISIVLVGSGWSAVEARLGAGWGFLLPLALFTFAMTTGAAGVRDPRTYELWYPEPRLGRADLVLKVANDISFLNTGFDAALPLTIVGVDSPALRWLFREWEVDISEIFDPVATPEMLITPLITDLSLTAEYRGEPLVWREMGDFYNVSFTSWLNWFIYRQIPVQREDIILWVRSDLMLESPEPLAP